jgi:hypothetical protein
MTIKNNYFLFVFIVVVVYKHNQKYQQPKFVVQKAKLNTWRRRRGRMVSNEACSVVYFYKHTTHIVNVLVLVVVFYLSILSQLNYLSLRCLIVFKKNTTTTKKITDFVSLKYFILLKRLKFIRDENQFDNNQV